MSHSIPVVAELRKDGHKKAPIQMCPMPYCRDRGAPAFGMVCKRHKDVPRHVVNKHREERKAKKAGK